MWTVNADTLSLVHQAQIDAALALRLEANEALKAGELSKALIGYNQVLLQLRGLESPISTVYGPGSTRPSESSLLSLTLSFNLPLLRILQSSAKRAKRERSPKRRLNRS